MADFYATAMDEV